MSLRRILSEEENTQHTDNLYPCQVQRICVPYMSQIVGKRAWKSSFSHMFRGWLLAYKPKSPSFKEMGDKMVMILWVGSANFELIDTWSDI